MATERRPTQRERKDMYLAARAMGGSVNMAAAASGIPRGTAYGWLQDEAFAREDEAAFERGSMELVEVIKRASIEDWRAAKALLERNAPVGSKIELTGAQGGAVRVEATIAYDEGEARAAAEALLKIPAPDPDAEEDDEDES